jgi:hypothetical protein
MPAACTVLLLHGLGNQAPDWSQAFRARLTAALGATAARVALVDVYWAPLSTRDHLLHPRLALDVAPDARLPLDDDTYNRAVVEFAMALGREAGVPMGPRGFGPGDLLDRLRGRLPGGSELLIDVGNYVGRNGVRTAVQHVLHERLAVAQREAPGAPLVLVAHSQGTIIAYDVLRQAGASYPQLRTWITMGSPLGKYQTLFQWGAERLGVPPTLRWVNLFDPRDLVGKALSPLVPWDAPRPVDTPVDNVAHAQDAHDHWHNAEVVAHVCAEVLQVVSP